MECQKGVSLHNSQFAGSATWTGYFSGISARIVEVSLPNEKAAVTSVPSGTVIGQNDAGWKVVWFPERRQPYTLWKGDRVVRFLVDREEALSWLGRTT